MRLSGPWRLISLVVAAALVVTGALLVAAPIRSAVLLLAGRHQRVTDVLPPAAQATTRSGAASSTAASASSVPATVLRARATLVGLGDSVPAGSACGCEPFVPRLGQQLATATGESVTAVNDALAGEDSGELLAALGRPTRTARDVSTADVVTITIGANDVSYASHASGSCGGAGGTACYQPQAATVAANVTALIRRIHDLRAGRPTTVVVTGYWNVWQDGAVARGLGPEFVRVSAAVTGLVNHALQQASLEEGATYVDLEKAFTAAGPDDTGLLAADGDHPNAAGHQLIADVIARAVLAAT